MHLVTRAVPLAVGLLALVLHGSAQPAELPGIFVPRQSPPATRPPNGGAHPTRAAASDRVRSLINTAATRALDHGDVGDAPNAITSSYVDPATGATVMAPMVVRGQALRESQVRPPDIRLFHFTPLGGDKYRRIAGGATMPIFHTFIGNKEFQADINVLNAAGRGIDHNIDFTRVEIAFTLKW